MGRHYVASVLMSISGQPPAKVIDAELAPIVPGAWAAWAASQKAEASGSVAPSKPTDQPDPASAPVALRSRASRA